MTVSIRINSISFETPVTTEFANPLTNIGESVQSIDETILTFSAVRVTAISLEIPVSVLSSENIVNSGQGIQSIDETIIGTPAAVETYGSVPSAFVGAGAPVHYALLRNTARSEQTIDEEILVAEDLVSVATSIQTIETLVHEKRVIHENRVLRDTPAQPVTTPPRITVKLSTVEPVQVIDDTIALKRRQKEEDELVLLGILG